MAAIMRIISAIFFPFLLLLVSCAPVAPARTSTPLTVPAASKTPTAVTNLASSDVATATAIPAATLTVSPGATAATDLHPFGTVNIDTADIEFDVRGDGQNVDSISFWEAADPAQSLMFVTSKGNSSVE